MSNCRLVQRITAPSCGDGIVESGEQCDDGSLNSSFLPGSCRSNCMKAWCGDGILDPGEQCDHGSKDGTSGDFCDAYCRILTPQGIPTLPPVAQLTPPEPPPYQANVTPVGPHQPLEQSGPATVAFMAAGAALGFLWMRRRSLASAKRAT